MLDFRYPRWHLDLTDPKKYQQSRFIRMGLCGTEDDSLGSVKSNVLPSPRVTAQPNTSGFFSSVTLVC
jgi:hypothetical protein